MRTEVGPALFRYHCRKGHPALYTTGKVQNVRIFGQPDGDGVKVIVAVQTRAVCNEIEIDGAEQVQAKILRKSDQA